MRRTRRLSIASLPLPILLQASAALARQDQLEPAVLAMADRQVWLPIVIVLMVVGAAAAGVLIYLWFLQRRFLEACATTGQIMIFADRPAGVPSGTVRSVMALFIVFATMAFLALSMLPFVPALKVPEMLTGILGTVIGFYFGSRTVDGAGAGQVLEKVEATQKQHDAAVRSNQQSRILQIEDKVRHGLVAARAAARILPGELGRKCTEIAASIEDGLAGVDRLRAGGDTAKALEEASRLAARLRREGPVKSVMLEALGSFSRVLGATAPPLAIATAVVAIGTKLAGAAYDRWVARVMHTPYTPELFPPTVIDANAALSLVRQSPIFSHAFADELEREDRAMMKGLIEHVLSEELIEVLWQQTTDRFADRETFDDGVAEVQQAAMNLEALKDVEEALAKEAGGVQGLLGAIDRINRDPAARADLDTIVLIADELKREGQAPAAVFVEARKDVEEEAWPLVA